MNSSYNITEIISQCINSLFGNLFSSIDNNVYNILDELAFINPNIIDDDLFKNIFGTNSTHGILLLCNSLLIGFIIFYSVKLFYSHFTFTETERPLQFLFKLIIFAILMNCSFFICEQILNLNSLISLSIREIGENIFNFDISFTELIKKLNTLINIKKDNFNMFSTDGILKAFISIELINLLLTFSLRYILVKIFVLISPFAFLSLISNNSSWFFKSWLRCFFSLLIIQSFVSLILLLTFSINIESNNIMVKILYLSALYALTKSNVYIKELVGGISTTFSNSIYTFKSLFK